MHRILVFVLFLSLGTDLQAQTNQKAISSLNNYVDFTNDCIHGLSIVHLMLQNFNDEVNKYVDEDDGNYVFQNSDFGVNIYDDISFFEHRQMTPASLYKKVIRESTFLKPNEGKALNATVGQMFRIAKSLNDLRFETEEILGRNSKSNNATIGEVYDKLELAVDQFNHYYQLRNKLNRQLAEIYKIYRTELNAPADYQLQKSTHKSFVDMLHSLRREKDKEFKSATSQLKKSAAALSKGSVSKEILGHASQGIKGGDDFINNIRVPDNHKRYGKHYYFYNQILLFKLNTIGAGMAYKMNETLQIREKQALRFLEMPALFKVLYPRKLVHMEAFSSSSRFIDALPDALDERKLKPAETSISTEKEIIVLELYDHMLLDGDIVSINFNGDWILKNKSLEKEPTKVKLRLNPEGKNYIILHAENEGIKPPNTMGISFFVNGKKKKVLMTSSMNTSQIMEINVGK